MVGALPIINTVLKGIDLLRTLSALGNESKRLHDDLWGSLLAIQMELQMIKGGIEKYEDLLTQELVYEIDDFVRRLWIPEKGGAFMLSAFGRDPRPGDITRIKQFTDRIKSLHGQRQKSSESTQSGGSSSAGSLISYAPEKDLVGIDGPKREIVELLSPGDLSLRVISIVGCSGVGKTALARALYDHPAAVADKFDCVAWVAVDHLRKNAEDHLNKILKQVRSSFKEKQDSSMPPASKTACEEVGQTSAGGGSTSEALHRFLMEKRYLVFIDDIQQKEVWDNIKDAFPINNRGSRIIVTTRIHSIADACSYGSYVYKMQCLDETKSKELFWRKARRCETAPPVPALALAPSPALANGSKSILVKCDGLPLALISAGNYLDGKKPLKSMDCDHLGKELGDYLAGDSAFAEMKRALVQCYDNLPDYNHKNCFLYVGIFPRGHQINSKSLARRFIAEELVDRDVYKGIAEELGFVRKCLEWLIDQSMIDPVLIRNESKVVERCKVHSIMLEFIIQKSLSRNFISLIQKQDGQVQQKTGSRVRRLTVQKAGSRLVLPTEIEESMVSDTVRSLTILKSDPHEETRVDAVDFKSYELLRVLDLEGCGGLNTVIDGICELIFLKYLGLRNTDVDDLPGKVKKLKFLETLDIRGTGVKRLPMKVIMLPQLAYLFGKFELTDVPKDTKKLEEFLSKKSQLHTLAGIVTNETQGFEIVIRHARMLKKVKVWCNDTPDDNTSGTAAPADNPRGKGPLWRKSRRPKQDGRPSGSRDPSTSTPDPAPVPVPVTPTTLGYPNPNTSPSTSSLAGILVSSLTLESLSIDSNGLCKEFLGSVQLTSCIISSIKLRGKLELLPTPATLKDYSNLNRLHLFSTGLSIQDLSALQNLECLEYLKLADDRDGSWDGIFHVQVDGFQSLICLCFEASKHPRVQIEHGAMTRLASLLLLCPESPPLSTAEIESRLGVEGILHLANLNEVILHHDAPDATTEAWKEAAKRHTNRPYVKKHPIPNSDTA